MDENCEVEQKKKKEIRAEGRRQKVEGKG